MDIEFEKIRARRKTDAILFAFYIVLIKQASKQTNKQIIKQ